MRLTDKTNGMRRQDVLDRPGHGPHRRLYHGPFADEAYGGCIRAVEKQKRSLKEMLRAARANRAAAALAA